MFLKKNYFFSDFFENQVIIILRNINFFQGGEIMKKLILILGIIGISVTSFGADRINSKVVYVKREPSRRQRRARIAAGRR